MKTLSDLKEYLKKIIDTGSSYALKGNTKHSFTAREDSEIIDIFTPKRENYMD